MGWGITFTVDISRVYIREIDARIENMEKLQEKNKAEFYILVSSTPSDNYDESGVFQHRTEYIRERAAELWESINETAKELAMLYAAKNADDVKEV